MDVMKGIRVVDLTAYAFVPAAGGVLAHWGADVIHVEGARRPDPIRMLGGSLEPGGAGTLFKHYSRGKRSIAIDLSSERGRDVLYKLVADADVFLTSYLPAARKKLRIDVDDIRAINPHIIYARGSGQGPKGPDAERPGFDGITWWARGSLADSAMDVSGATWPTAMVGHGDGMSGLVLAGGICAALLQRERTGATPIVDGSLLGTAAWFNGPALIAASQGEAPRERAQATRPADSTMPALMQTYQTKDGRFLSFCHIPDYIGADDRDFHDLCERIGRSDLASDARFSASAERKTHDAELVAVLDEVFAERTLAEWKSVLVTARGAWSPVATPAELHADPQNLANGFLRHVDYPDGGMSIPVPPIQFDEEAGDPSRAPDFAEHTDEILAELGLDAGEIASLRDSGDVA
jgi:crotonobetainyl-CoA:carnitine CoA-transferase CaiB-like acyl-CoA transferase